MDEFEIETKKLDKAQSIGFITDISGSGANPVHDMMNKIENI